MTLIALCGTLSAGIASAQDVKTVLEKAEKSYHSATSFKAEFTQTIVNPMLGGPEHSRGVMYLNPPDRFAMRFSDPAGDRIVADGQWLWFFTPSTTPDQVIRQPVPKAGEATPNFFAQFLDRPMERYRATLVGKDTIGGTTVDVVKLVPKFNDQPFREAVIAIGRQDGLMRRVALVEESGQRRTVLLPAPQAGVPIADEEFRFRAPKGVKVVSP
jgi:outer membrane lipoprotein carrier protein